MTCRSTKQPSEVRSMSSTEILDRLHPVVGITRKHGSVPHIFRRAHECNASN